MSQELLVLERVESTSPVIDFESSTLVGAGFSFSLAQQCQLLLKRVCDIVLSLGGIFCLLPFFAILAICIRLSSPGPVIYKSKRIGRFRKPFYMFKFRTMVQNAEDLRGELAEKNDLTDGLFKLKHDSRVTPLGSFLRKYSLDEFPQLFNVLMGHMSLVGPRPYIPEESRLFQPPYTMRFYVFPGMTGPWQVSGRSNLSFQDVCNLELQYVKSWSFFKDIAILFSTVPAVVLKKGAY